MRALGIDELGATLETRVHQKQALEAILTSRPAVHAGDVDGIALCRMYYDPLFLYHQWQANLRILGAHEIKSIPYTPLSHPFVERLIGTIRREFLDQTLFWNASDLGRKLADFHHYYNSHRVPTALAGVAPSETSGEKISHCADLGQFRWKSHCRGLYQLPVAA